MYPAVNNSHQRTNSNYPSRVITVSIPHAFPPLLPMPVPRDDRTTAQNQCPPKMFTIQVPDYNRRQQTNGIAHHTVRERFAQYQHDDIYYAAITHVRYMTAPDPGNPLVQQVTRKTVAFVFSFDGAALNRDLFVFGPRHGAPLCFEGNGAQKEGNQGPIISDLVFESFLNVFNNVMDRKTLLLVDAIDYSSNPLFPKIEVLSLPRDKLSWLQPMNETICNYLSDPYGSHGYDDSYDFRMLDKARMERLCRKRWSRIPPGYVRASLKTTILVRLGM
jgi:hypothetical protein